MQQAGFTEWAAWDFNRIYREFLGKHKEIERIAKLEMFDEFEEWNIFMAHYCLVFAVCYPIDHKDNATDVTNENSETLQQNSNKSENDKSHDNSASSNNNENNSANDTQKQDKSEEKEEKSTEQELEKTKQIVDFETIKKIWGNLSLLYHQKNPQKVDVSVIRSRPIG
ncbi:leucine carboxyl methyltransferase [Reticulomyxa filosa]|uniref:Leucine carboxyl methyltransferase n=1 Tax=Reticulomyxa filosa TaxID=46433 RepID=X6NHV5_RETFI|nr:leucine carboxyl methyltransferase [Reticulomyxa filosa]|eukprot:ETO25483.1 leucine carboxyl methyltransferase [Reticulomyxa filosa]